MSPALEEGGEKKLSQCSSKGRELGTGGCRGTSESKLHVCPLSRLQLIPAHFPLGFVCWLKGKGRIFLICLATHTKLVSAVQWYWGNEEELFLENKVPGMEPNKWNVICLRRYVYKITFMSFLLAQHFQSPTPASDFHWVGGGADFKPDDSHVTFE